MGFRFGLPPKTTRPSRPPPDVTVHEPVAGHPSAAEFGKPCGSVNDAPPLAKYEVIVEPTVYRFVAPTVGATKLVPYAPRTFRLSIGFQSRPIFGLRVVATALARSLYLSMRPATSM